VSGHNLFSHPCVASSESPYPPGCESADVKCTYPYTSHYLLAKGNFVTGNVVGRYRAEQTQTRERDRQVESTCRKIGAYVIAFGAIDGKSNTERQTADVRKTRVPVSYYMKPANRCDSETAGEQPGSGGAAGTNACEPQGSTFHAANRNQQAASFLATFLSKLGQVFLG